MRGKTIGVRISQSDWHSLARLAKAETRKLAAGRSAITPSDLVREAIARFLEETHDNSPARNRR